MKPLVTFVGTVSTEPKFVEGQNGKKGFVGATVESPDSYSQYHNRVKAVWYGNTDVVLNQLKKGQQVLVTGDGSVETYMSQKSQKTVGILKVFVRTWEIIGESTGAEAPRPAPGPKPAPKPAAPAVASADMPEDDVPF